MIGKLGGVAAVVTRNTPAAATLTMNSTASDDHSNLNLSLGQLE